MAHAYSVPQLFNPLWQWIICHAHGWVLRHVIHVAKAEWVDSHRQVIHSCISKERSTSSVKCFDSSQTHGYQSVKDWQGHWKVIPGCRRWDFGDVDTSDQQSPQVNVKTSGRHISLSARRACTGSGFCHGVPSHWVNSHGAWHNLSQSLCIKRNTEWHAFHFTAPWCWQDPACARETGKLSSLAPASKQRGDPASHTYTVPSQPWYKVIHGSIHNPGYYPFWLLLHSGETLGLPVGSDDWKWNHG